MNDSGSGSGSGEAPPLFSCTDPSTFSSDGISNVTHWSLAPEVEKYLSIPVAIILAIMNILALFWNLFILLTYLYKHHLLKHSANIFLFSLALVDFLMSVTVMPASVITYAAGEYILGSTDMVRCGFCYFHGFLLMFSPTISLTLLAMLSMDRCFLLSKPLVYKKREKPLVAALASVGVWIFCILLCSLPAYGFGQWEFNISIAVCSARYTPLSNLLFMFVLFLYVTIPVIILGVTNIWTFRIVKRFLNRQLKRKRSYRGSFKEKKEDSMRHHQQQTQLVKVFGALFIANTVIWSPLIIMAMVVVAVGPSKIPNWPYAIFWLMVASNTVVHPILESFFNKELRLVVNKSKRKLSMSVSRTSRSLIRKLTSQSINRGIPDLSETDTKGNSTVVTDTERGESVTNSSDPPFSFHPVTPDNVVKDSPRARRIGTTDSPLLTKVRSIESPVFEYPTNGAVTSSVRSTSMTNSTPSPKPSATSPVTPGYKKRTVSITLPDDDRVYYPYKTHSPPPLHHEETVFEDDGEEGTNNSAEEDTRDHNDDNHDHTVTTALSVSEGSLDDSNSDSSLQHVNNTTLDDHEHTVTTTLPVSEGSLDDNNNSSAELSPPEETHDSSLQYVNNTTHANSNGHIGISNGIQLQDLSGLQTISTSDYSAADDLEDDDSPTLV